MTNPGNRYPGNCRLLYKEDLIKDKKLDDDPGCNIQMDVNLCIWSKTPCRFKPYLPLHPHMKRMGPHFMTVQLCSVGFSVHTNIPLMQPTQQLNRGVHFFLETMRNLLLFGLFLEEVDSHVQCLVNCMHNCPNASE